MKSGDWLSGVKDEIIPYQHTSLDVKIIQKIREKPRKDKQKEIHPQRFNFVNDLLENFIAAFLHYFLHNLDAGIHILEVFTKVSNNQKVLAMRHPYKDLVSLQLCESAEQQKSYMKVHALSIPNAFIAKSQVF